MNTLNFVIAASYKEGDPLLTASELAWLTEHGQVLHRGAGHVFFEEGEATDFVLLIMKGNVKVSAGRPKRIIAIRETGQVVGEMAPLRRMPRSASVEAIGDVEALYIPATRWIEFLDLYPRAARAQLVSKDERLVEATQRIAEAEFAVERRVALAITRMIDSGLGAKTDSGVLLSTSQSDVASLASASLESVKKIVHNFREHGIVETGRQKLLVANHERLREIAQGEFTAADRRPIVRAGRR